MKVLFWISLAMIGIPYLAYPLWLYFRARWRPRPVRPASIFPRVTILVAVRNEEKHILRKLENLAGLEYPPDRLETIVISDGSTDATNKYLAAWQTQNRRAFLFSNHRGKAASLNRGIAEARGDIVVFTDARQLLAAGGLKNIIANFADPTVGCVSGQLILNEGPLTRRTRGFDLYWNLEKKIRHWEGLAGSVVGATGAFYAVRRSLLSPIPAETILDDVLIPVRVVQQGKRAIFEPDAVAFDDLSTSLTPEFRRKVRTLAGNYQLLRLAPWILTRPNALRTQFVCHKLLRLLVPFALAGLFLCAIPLRGSFYEIALVVQVVFYALAVLSVFRARAGIVSRLADISLAFIVLNLAAAVAFLYFVTGRKTAWAR